MSKENYGSVRILNYLIFDLGILLEIKEVQPIPAVAQSSILLHPQEEAVRIRMAARQKQVI